MEGAFTGHGFPSVGAHLHINGRRYYRASFTKENGDFY
jgi:hypothetical protein